MSQIVYVLINEAMPGYVKIGLTTTSIIQRMKELDTTSVPLPFECYYAATVSDAQKIEKLLHDAFLDRRVRSSREFFQISPDRVVSAIKLAEIENITPTQDIVENSEDQKALDEARQRRNVFHFGMVHIAPGSELTFSEDANITARVIDNRWIEFNGQKTSLSEAARGILGYSHKVQGTIYWMYDGETLDERRRRMEQES